MKKSRPLIGIIAAEAEYVFFSNALNTIQKELFAANMDAAVFSSLMMSGNAEFDAGVKEFINSTPTNLANNGGDDTVSAVTAMGYDAYFTALEAIKAAGSADPKAVNEALWGVKYDGVTGHIEFNETGDAKRDAAYVKTANTETGAWDFVAVQKVESDEQAEG